jgi:tetratricopeptide (TPR) repeat protein
MLAGASLLQSLVEPDLPPPFFVGQSAVLRLANLEISPPGCDPRRRVSALGELAGALGEDAGANAVALAGWSALAANDVDGARGSFERATTARPSDLASWEGLRACAEITGNGPLCAAAAAELGARCDDDARGAAFWEEAALLWLDLGDDQNADRALEASFARDAGRAVAFDKLFRRVRARKDNDKLLALIERRLAVADQPQEIQKLFWEQARVLREKGDQDGALKSLEHVTMLDPDHVGALALLGEINIRRGHFEDAAASLARLAMLDGAPAKNRVTAGVAAVDLYEKKLDRYDKALEVLVSLHQAKFSTLPVRERLARAAARTGAWNEATSMLEELMNERADAQGRIEAARLAMTIHRDRLGRPQGAAAAIARLLEESPADGEALDMLLEIEQPRGLRDRLLDNARRALVDSLQKQPTDVTAVRRLAKVGRALSDEALHGAALGVLVSLGAADARSEQTLLQIATKKSRPPQIAISDAMLRELLAPGDEGPIADLFVQLGPTLVEALGPTLAACNVGRRDKVDPRSGLALRNEIAAWAGAFGVHAFDLYVGGSDASGVQGIPGDPPALVVGSAINAPIAPLARARIARELLAIVRGTTVARLRDDMTVAAIVVAACKIAQVPIQHPPYAVLAEVERAVGKAIGRKTRKLLPELCSAIVSRAADARLWTRRALASQDRIGAVASGDPSVVLADVLGVPHGNLGPAVGGDSRAEELLRFVLSPRYLEIRRSLGLDGSDLP